MILSARQLEEMGFATVTWPVSACTPWRGPARAAALLRDGHTTSATAWLISSSTT
jgi:hypothetical protein